jgi:hypothetical protein
VPAKWSVEFCPLSQPTQKEIVDARKVQCEIDVAYIGAGVLSQENVARARFGGDQYSFETKVDVEELDAMAQAAEDARAQFAAADEQARDAPPDDEETDE